MFFFRKTELSFDNFEYCKMRFYSVITTTRSETSREPHFCKKCDHSSGHSQFRRITYFNFLIHSLSRRSETVDTASRRYWRGCAACDHPTAKFALNRTFCGCISTVTTYWNIVDFPPPMSFCACLTTMHPVRMTLMVEFPAAQRLRSSTKVFFESSLRLE